MNDLESNYEKLMTDAFEITNYTSSETEKIALKDLSVDFMPIIDLSFGSPEKAQANFDQLVTEILGLEGKEEIRGRSYESLWGIRTEAIKTFSTARLMYEAKKEQFDKAYGLVLSYMEEKHPQMIQGLSR